MGNATFYQRFTANTRGPGFTAYIERRGLPTRSSADITATHVICDSGSHRSWLFQHDTRREIKKGIKTNKCFVRIATMHLSNPQLPGKILSCVVSISLMRRSELPDPAAPPEIGWCGRETPQSLRPHLLSVPVATPVFSSFFFPGLLDSDQGDIP